MVFLVWNRLLVKTFGYVINPVPYKARFRQSHCLEQTRLSAKLILFRQNKQDYQQRWYFIINIILLSYHYTAKSITNTQRQYWLLNNHSDSQLLHTTTDVLKIQYLHNLQVSSCKNHLFLTYKRSLYCCYFHKTHTCCVYPSCGICIDIGHSKERIDWENPSQSCITYYNNK